MRIFRKRGRHAQRKPRRGEVTVQVDRDHFGRAREGKRTIQPCMTYEPRCSGGVAVQADREAGG
jgi:hypothetical protein